VTEKVVVGALPVGGTERPPRGNGVDVIAGDPPKVVASLPTGKGGCAVAISKDGARAAVASGARSSDGAMGLWIQGNRCPHVAG
jgi:hypothetical protein